MESHLATRLREFIGESYLFGDVGRMPGDDDSLMGTGIIDSTGVLELIEFIEEEFGIHVDDSETIPENLDSVAGLVGYISAKRAEGAA